MDNNVTTKERLVSFKDGRAIFSFEIQLSEKRRLDKDSGFLYCDEAIFGHTGVQEYYASEVGLDGNGIVKVHRFADDVFNDEAMASIEGKSVTREHPSEMVTSKNAKNYDVGTILKVWRDGENVVGNIVIKDMETIEDITEHRMEALSLGYKANLVDMGNGEFRQTDLRINHLAVVKKGRARNARIMDEDTLRKEKPRMGLFDWLTGRKIKPHEDGTITIMDEGVETTIEDAKRTTVTKTTVDETYTYDDETGEMETSRQVDEKTKTTVEQEKEEPKEETTVQDTEKEEKKDESEDVEPIMTDEQIKAFKDEMRAELLAEIKKSSVFEDVHPTQTQEVNDETAKPELKLDFEQDEKLRKHFWDLYTNPTAHGSIKEFNEFRKQANRKFAV